MFVSGLTCNPSRISLRIPIQGSRAVFDRVSTFLYNKKSGNKIETLYVDRRYSVGTTWKQNVRQTYKIKNAMDASFGDRAGSRHRWLDANDRQLSSRSFYHCLHSGSVAANHPTDSPDAPADEQQEHSPAAEVIRKANAEAEDPITKLDIRVGLITKVETHPDADSLYVEDIDVGEESPRTVVSGLVKYIPLEELQNRKVCVLCNLKPRNMRGIKSQAMVLAASNEDHTKVELVEPPESAPPGERVTFPPFQGEPNKVGNSNSKIFEKLQVDLHTDTELVACYKDVPFTTSAGVCKVSSISGGAIR